MISSTEAGIEEPLEVFMEESDVISSRNRGGSDGTEQIEFERRHRGRIGRVW